MANPSSNPTELKKHNNADLQSLYRDGDSVDQEVFAEYRSNLLLIAGEHYNRRQSSFYRRIRDSRELSQEQKMRLTKNHIQKIFKTYVNNVLSASPNVGFEPKDESSLQNQKQADLNHSVWRDAWERYDLDDQRDDWCDSFMGIGEVWTEIIFDPDAGPVTAVEQKLDEEGQPVFFDHEGVETSQPYDMLTNKPNEMCPDPALEQHQGEFLFKEHYGFNILRPAECKDLRKSAWLCTREMVNKEWLKKKYANDPDAVTAITASGDETFMVFEGARAGYRKTDTEVLIMKFFFRPCVLYPKGHYFIKTKTAILEDDDLPGGIFPLVGQTLEKIPTTPRGRGPVKQMRPYQAEINRAASKMAEHQITLGDDKLIIQNGTKASAGVSLPGVRTINVTGQAPTVLQGRSGDQYLAYMNSQIQELYMVMNVKEDGEQKQPGQIDPYSLLYMSAKQKRAFQRHSQRFGKYLINVCKTYLELAKLYLPQDQLIYAVGKNEVVNIAEFKNQARNCYNIIIEQQSDDIETKMGKQLVMNHLVQFVGPQLQKDDLGKIMRSMPYVNDEESFSDMTIDYDSIKDDMLAMDRGEQPPAHPYDKHPYVIQHLMSRTRKRDFQLLAPQIQQSYWSRIQLHEQLQAQQAQQQQRMEQGFIPTTGYLASCQLYVPDSKDPTVSRQVRVPSDALQWLVQHLQSQGTTLQEFGQMNPGVQGQIAGMMPSGGPSQHQHPPMQPARPMGPPNGMGRPMAPPPHPMGAPNGMRAPMAMPNGMGRR